MPRSGKVSEMCAGTSIIRVLVISMHQGERNRFSSHTGRLAKLCVKCVEPHHVICMHHVERHISSAPSVVRNHHRTLFEGIENNGIMVTLCKTETLASRVIINAS